MGAVYGGSAQGPGAGGLQPNGDAWNYFARSRRSRVFRWRDDGIGGISISTAALSGIASGMARSPVLKERLFGVTARRVARRRRDEIISTGTASRCTDKCGWFYVSRRRAPYEKLVAATTADRRSS